MSTEAYEKLQYLLAQVAAESYIDNSDLRNEESFKKYYIQGANRDDKFVLLEALDELGLTQSTGLMWSDFSENWDIIQHQKNTFSGFSGTLLKSKSGGYAISFRSTESKEEAKGGDVDRDSAKGANGEISMDGFAWAQIRDMEKFFANLTAIESEHYDADFAAHMAGNGKLSVTGYSLGGHLAQVFTQLHREDILHTYTINGAGIGWIDGVVEGNPIGNELADILAKIDFIIENPLDSAALLSDSMLSQILYKFGRDELDPATISAMSSVQKLQWIVEENNRWKIDPSANSNVYTSPLYQLAVSYAGNRTTGTFSQGVLNLVGADIDRHETPDHLISNIYGHATTKDEEFVAISGQRFGEPIEVFIEDQANSNNYNLLDALFDTDRSFQDDIAQMWGDTHSITLVIDTLYVADLMQRLDPTISLMDITEKILPMASNDTASRFEPDDVEANSLENTINALGRLYVPSWTDILQEEADEAFGDIEYRNILHNKIDDLRHVFDTRNQSEFTSIEVLTELPADAILAVALQDDSEKSTGYRYALANLMPFAVVSNLGGTAAADPEYDLANSSEQYFTDRAFMLSNLLGMNLRNDAHGLLLTPTKFSHLSSDAVDDIVFDGDFKGYGSLDTASPEMYDPQRTRYVFGSVNVDNSSTIIPSDNDDHLYGMAGDDSIEGLDGSDYIEGGVGGDKLYGGEKSDQLFGGPGDDEITGGAGSDYLVGGADSDTFFWHPGDGDDFIGDYDTGGDRIVIDGVDLSIPQFVRESGDSPYYRANGYPDITLHYAGDFLTIHAGTGADAGSVTLMQYSPLAGADYGIGLREPQVAAPGSDIEVTELGSTDAEVNPLAFWRYESGQGGRNWSTVSIRFDAAEVANYAAGLLHGTAGGAFEGGPLADFLTGDPGSNALHGLAGNDLIEGLAGDDLLEAGPGSDRVFGGAGNDVLFGGVRIGLASKLDAKNGAYDQFYLAQIAESADDVDTLDGGEGPDYVSGGGGTDYISGGAGADRLFGGAGADYISGGAERDVIYGDSALDYRHIETEPRTVNEEVSIAFAGGVGGGGFYDDVIHGGDGRDTAWGELGDDKIYGGAGDDDLIGDRYHHADYFAAEWQAYGDTSPDLDVLWHGDDQLYGEDGNDLLLGLGGNDLLAGGRDTDTLDGGAGDDTYHFQAGDGLDYIDDGEGIHTLLFSGITLRDLQVVFQRDQVLIGTGYGTQGLYLSRSEWPNVRIALDTPDATIERSRLDQFYFDASGTLLFTVKGTDAMSESDREALFSVDTSDPNKPRVVVSAAADAVEIENLVAGGSGGRVRIASGLLQLILELSTTQINRGLDFLNLADGVAMDLVGYAGEIIGTDGANRIVGSASADTIRAYAGDDVLEGRGSDDSLYGGWGRDSLFGDDGDDLLDGGAGDDALYGGAGADNLYGGGLQDRDYLEGGRGDDVLRGGPGPDHYYFSAGDGRDTLEDHEGYLYFDFAPNVDPASVTFNYTASANTNFRIEYGRGDMITADSSTSLDSVNGVTVAGVAIPLVQRSDVVDGTFWDTDWNDVFEPGDGSDTIRATGRGEDTFRFFAGDGQDSILINNSYYPEFQGEIRLADNIDPGSLSFGFLNGSATISYGAGDQLTLDPNTVYTPMDNALTRFSLVSEADPDWIPLIRAEGYVGPVYGTYGSDHIIGGINSEIIFPGYGDDLIETGGGADRIVLNDVYVHAAAGGIGRKSIWGDADNNTVETPLHQGLAFHYAPGDGRDTITYDWSFSREHPYAFQTDHDQATAVFQPHGPDTIIFGEGITLADLRFQRTDDTLNISLRDGSGGLRLSGFFYAWDADRTAADAADLYQLLSNEGSLPTDLRHPVILAALPRTPIAALHFADGTSHDLVSVLEASLELSDATLLGTEGNDQMYGTDGDDVVHLLGGDDFIEEISGNNVIDAGAGDDSITTNGGVNRIDPGPGDDFVQLFDGENTVLFGPGSGTDRVDFIVGNGSSTVLELGAGLTLADIAVTWQSTEWDAPLVTLTSSGDSILLTALALDEASGHHIPDPHSSLDELRFADGTILSGEELLELAGGVAGEAIEGTDGRDVLKGTEAGDTIIGGRGDDTLHGLGGDDLFPVTGADQGVDRIIGGPGFDAIVGGDGDDVITLNKLLVRDAVELIDGGPGHNVVAGTAKRNKFDFSATTLRDIALIDAGDGNDVVSGSPGDDRLLGGPGKDVLMGNAGHDTYLFGAGDGRDEIRNNDSAGDSVDTLQFNGIAHDELWFSRKGNHLLVDVVGSDDQVRVHNWYHKPEQQLDAVTAGGQALLFDQVDRLVSAMAAFDVPEGVGAIIPPDVRQQLEPVLAVAWQPAPV